MKALSVTLTISKPIMAPWFVAKAVGGSLRVTLNSTRGDVEDAGSDSEPCSCETDERGPPHLDSLR